MTTFKSSLRAAGFILLTLILVVGLAPSSQGASKNVTSKAQVLNAIKKMKALQDKSDSELAALDGVEETCTDKFQSDHPENTQIRDAWAFCDADPAVMKYRALLLKNGELQNLTQDSILAANRALKIGRDFEKEFLLALNFQWVWSSFEIYTRIKTADVSASEIPSLAKKQNLYSEGYWIAQKYSSKQARDFLVKTKSKIDLAASRPYLEIFRKAAFM